MKKILFTLLLTIIFSNVSAQTKNVQKNDYYIYTVFTFPGIHVNENICEVPIINIVKINQNQFVSENGKPLLFDSGMAARNYLGLHGWEKHSGEGIFHVYKKKVTREQLEKEVAKRKNNASYEEVLNAYNRDINKYPSMAGYKMVKVEGQVDISDK